jgi:hypothetical protein
MGRVRVGSCRLVGSEFLARARPIIWSGWVGFRFFMCNFQVGSVFLGFELKIGLHLTRGMIGLVLARSFFFKRVRSGLWLGDP